MKKHKKKGKKGVAVAFAEATEPAPETAPAKATGREHDRLERRRVVNEDLRLELQSLQETVHDMLARFQLKLDAELVQLTAAASGSGAFAENGRRLPISVAENMIKQMRALDIKPNKGRAKDLQRVHDLVGALIEQLP